MDEVGLAVGRARGRGAGAATSCGSLVRRKGVDRGGAVGT
jgi:hypothetical protein